MQEIVKVIQGTVIPDPKNAKEVLRSVDQILEYSRDAVQKVERAFMRLALLLVEVKEGAYWTVRDYQSEDEYIAATFPQSRAQYYRLIRIGARLGGRYPVKLLESLGSSKCEDLARVQVHCDGVIPENWWLHAKEEDKETFRRRVRSYLSQERTTKDPTVEDQFFGFRVFGDAINIVNRAFEIVARIIGSEKSWGHRLELICANFLAQFEEDGTGHVFGKNAFILNTIQGLIEQLDLSQGDCANRLVGVVRAGLERAGEPKEEKG